MKITISCFRLAQEEEVIQAKTRAEELEKENSELANNLAKREQEQCCNEYYSNKWFQHSTECLNKN